MDLPGRRLDLGCWTQECQRAPILEIDLVVVWNVIEGDLPALKESVQEIMAQEG